MSKRKWIFPPLQVPTIFIGSPSDVSFLREAVIEEFQNLKIQVADIGGVELYSWEDEQEKDVYYNRPFQGGIPLTNDENCLAAIFVFGERIGMDLPFDFPKDRLNGTPAWDPHTYHLLSHPWEKNTPDAHFPLTGSTFEFLVAERAGTDFLVIFFGDESVEGNQDVLTQNWGMSRLLEDKKRIQSPAEHEVWLREEAIPQRTKLRNFYRYLKEDRTIKVFHASDEEKARRRIRTFLREKLNLNAQRAIENPFRYLAAYGVDDNDVFFGRDILRNEIATRIKERMQRSSEEERPVFCIHGPSGSGKSSLMRAGVIGRLRKFNSEGFWIDSVLRPSQLPHQASLVGETDPLLALYANCLCKINNQPERESYMRELARVMPARRAARAVNSVMVALNKRSAKERRTYNLAIGLDQFEELFENLLSTDQESIWSNFIEFLEIVTLTGKVAVLYTIPNSRISEIERHPNLQGWISSGLRQEIGFPEDTVEEIVDESFALVRPKLSKGLKQRLLSSVQDLNSGVDKEDKGTILPLLSLAMSRIYERWLSRKENDRLASYSPTLKADFEEAEDQESAIPRTEGHGVTDELDLESYGDLAEFSSIIDQEGSEALKDANKDAAGLQVEEQAVPALLRLLVRILPHDRNHFDLLDIALPRDAAMQAMAIALRRHRLITDNRDGRFRLVHEAVLRHWKNAREWLEQERKRLEYVSSLSETIRTWEVRKNQAVFLEGLDNAERTRAAEVLYTWASTFAPVSSDEVVDYQNRQLGNFLIATLEHRPTPYARIPEIETNPTFFHVAVAVDARRLVKELIADDPGLVNLQREKDQRTPLFEAAFLNRTEILSLLLDSGAPVDAPDSTGWLPLHLAAFRGHSQVLDILLPKVRDVNEPGGPEMATALMLAAFCGKAEAMRKLIKYGAVVNIADKGKWTPLHTAVYSNHIHATELLLQYQADTEASLDFGWTPLHLAAQEGGEEVALLLIERGADVEKLLENGCTPLHVAAQKGSETVARRLIDDGGANIHALGTNDWRTQEQREKRLRKQQSDFSNWTPLHFAADAGQDSIIKLLIERLADANKQGGSGKTPLHLAVEKGHLQAIQRLLEYWEIQIDLTDSDHRTALHIAFDQDNLHLAQLLIDAGANLDLDSETRDAPIHLAASNGDERLFRFLARNNADVHLRNQRNWAPLHSAADRGRERIIRHLLRKGVNVNESAPGQIMALHLAVAGNHENAVRALLEHPDIQVDAADEDQLQPLHIATLNGRTAIVRDLIEHGSPINARDNTGWTPLHLAAQNGHLEVVELLLQNGADLKMVSGSPPQTPLQSAVETGQEAIVNLLLKSGADPETGNTLKARPLVLATRYGYYTITHLLMQAGAVPEGPTGKDLEVIVGLFAKNANRRLQTGEPAGKEEERFFQSLVAAGYPAEALLEKIGDSSIQFDNAIRAGGVQHPGPTGIGNVWNYTWVAADHQRRADLLNKLGGVDKLYELSLDTTEVMLYPLPWYDEIQLVRLKDPSWRSKDLYLYFMITKEGLLFRLNGTSLPIHELNAKAPIRLNDSNVLDYLRFFCFFVRGEEGAFYIIENLDDPIIPRTPSLLSVLEMILKPARMIEEPEKGTYLCDAVIYYSNALFFSEFEILANGNVNMISDKPIAADLPGSIHTPLG